MLRQELDQECVDLSGLLQVAVMSGLGDFFVPRTGYRVGDLTSQMRWQRTVVGESDHQTTAG